MTRHVAPAPTACGKAYKKEQSVCAKAVKLTRTSLWVFLGVLITLDLELQVAPWKVLE